jgi:hypothetical protein
MLHFLQSESHTASIENSLQWGLMVEANMMRYLLPLGSQIVFVNHLLLDF